MKIELTPSERQHALAMDRLFSGDFSTPASRQAAIDHHTAFKRLVTAKPEQPIYTDGRRPNGLYSWQNSPWD